MSTEFWATLVIAVATVMFLIPGVVFAYFVLESWIGDPDSYGRIVAAVESVP